jgi:thiamine pyrophosphate-dependent acetolactate synthase large subunit-like protein
LVEIAELLGCSVVESRSTGVINIPRTHPLHSGYDVKEIVQNADVIFLASVIAPWHPASITPAKGAKVAMLDENPLRAEIPYYGYQCDLCLTGEIESSLEHLLAALKKKVSKGDAARAPAESSKARTTRGGKNGERGDRSGQSKTNGHTLGGP